MAKLSWGKCDVEYRLASDSTGEWSKFPTPVENTTKLNVTKGTKLEAKLEGGAYEDVKYQKNTYTLEFELYAGVGFTRPISDFDGVILDNYSIRVRPENPAAQALILDKCALSVEDSFDTQIGAKVKYTADVLVPDDESRQIKWEVIASNDNE